MFNAPCMLDALCMSDALRMLGTLGRRQGPRGPPGTENLIMAMPFHLTVKLGTYLMQQKLRGVKKYPLIMELEPLYACNLKCGGCGKIQQPAALLKQRMSVETAIAAVEECGDGPLDRHALLEQRRGLLDLAAAAALEVAGVERLELHDQRVLLDAAELLLHQVRPELHREVKRHRHDQVSVSRGPWAAVYC